MPVVSTKFKVDGEADYKKALSQIAGEAKVLKSELGYVKEAFSDNADVLDGLTEKGRIYQEQIKNQKDRIAVLEDALKDAADKYGVADRRTQEWKTSLNNARTELVKLEKNLETNNEEMKEYAEATEDGKEQTSGLGDMIKGLTDKLNIQLPSGLANAANGMSGFIGAASLAAAGIGAIVAGIAKAEEALINMTIEAADSAGKIIDLSSQTNMSTESVQKWDYVLRAAGSSMEEAQGDFSSLQEKMREALDPTSESAELFKTLGVNVQNADGSLRDVDGVMYDVVEALSEMEDKTNRNAISSELLGGTGEKLTTIYDEQRGSLEELMAKKEENGILTDEELEKLDTLNGKMGDLQDKTDTLKTKLASEFAP